MPRTITHLLSLSLGSRLSESKTMMVEFITQSLAHSLTSVASYVVQVFMYYLVTLKRGYSYLSR